MWLLAGFPNPTLWRIPKLDQQVQVKTSLGHTVLLPYISKMITPNGTGNITSIDKDYIPPLSLSEVV